MACQEVTSYFGSSTFRSPASVTALAWMTGRKFATVRATMRTATTAMPARIQRTGGVSGSPPSVLFWNGLDMLAPSGEKSHWSDGARGYAGWPGGAGVAGAVARPFGLKKYAFM